MSFQRIHPSSSQNPQISRSTSQFAPRPFSLKNPQPPLTQQDTENQELDQDKLEAAGLQLKEKDGTITPVEQEKLGVLQAKMDSFQIQRREGAKAQPSLLAILVRNAQSAQASEPAPVQPRLAIDKSGDQSESAADRPAAEGMAMPSPVSTPPIQPKASESTSVEAESQTAHSEDSQDVEPVVTQIVNALQVDPNDRSGQIKQLFVRLNPSTRQAVRTQLQTRLTPEQQQSLQAILSDPAPAQTELPPEQMAPNQASAVEDQDQGRANSSHMTEPTEQTITSPASTDSSQTALANDRQTEPKTNSSDVPIERQSTTSDQALASNSSESGASVAPEQVNSQQAAIPKNGSRQGSAEDASTSRQGEGQAKTAKAGSLSSNGKSSLDQAANQANSSEPRSGSSSPEGQPSSRGVATLGAGSQGRNPNQKTTAAQLPPSSEIQAPSGRSQGTQALLEQVATAAASARQRFTERITQGTEAIAANVQQQQTALIAAGEQQVGAIQALFANARAQAGEIITSAQAQLQTDATSHLASLQQGHTATLGQVATTFSSGQERAQNLGNTYAERSLQTADESAQQVQTQIQGMAQESQAIGQEKAQVGSSTPEIAQAKARAANEIASDTATKITSGVSDAMRDLRTTGPETARGFREQGQEAARQVGTGQTQVVNQLNTANQQTSTGIQRAVTQGSQALGNLGTQLTAQLTALEQTIQNQLQAEIAQKNQEIATAGQQAITTFQQQGQQAIASGDEHLTQFNQQLADMDVDPELVAPLTGEIVGQVNGAYDNLIATTDGAFQQADSALTQAGTEVITAINAISTNAAGQIQTFLGQAQGQVTQQVGTISSQLGTTVTQANAAGSTTVSEVAANLEGQLSQVDSGFEQGLEQYQGGLNEQVASAVNQASEPRQSVSGRIDQAQHRAEERAQNNWFVNQWNDFLEMVHSPGFWAGLITGLILGAIVVALIIGGVLTGGVAIVAAAAIVGAIAAGVGTAVGNRAEGKPWHEGIVSNMIWGAFGGAVGAAALLFLGGVATGLGLGAGATLALLTVGASVTAGIVTVLDNIAHDRPWDKGLLANMALAGILTWVGGKIEGFVKGRTSGGGSHPTAEEPSTRPSTEETPGTKPQDTPDPLRSIDEEPAGKMDTGSRDGLEKTPETIREGSVRMEQHPNYQSVIAEIEGLGFEIRQTSGDPHVSVREVLNPEGQVIRVEKFVHLREGMRFLDLEHELGHVRQLSERFGENPLPTERVIESPDGKIKQAGDQSGVLTNWQNTVTEYHNRLVEFLRLHERGASPSLLREHARGVSEWRSQYLDKGLKGGRSPSRQQWVNEHFSDLPELENQYRSAGGSELER